MNSPITPLKPSYFLNVLIWLDQGANVLIYGTPDETISARAYRNSKHHQKPRWVQAEKFINLLFFWQKDNQGNRNHCERAYIAELERKQYPREYQ